MFNVSSAVNGKKVVSTHVVHLKDVDGFTIYFDDWKMYVKFADDSGSSRYVSAVEGNSLVLTLYNHNNTIGEAIFSPFAVAATVPDAKTVWMTYFSAVIEKSTKTRRFEYSIWLDE